MIHIFAETGVRGLIESISRGLKPGFVGGLKCPGFEAQTYPRDKSNGKDKIQGFFASLRMT